MNRIDLFNHIEKNSRVSVLKEDNAQKKNEESVKINRYYNQNYKYSLSADLNSQRAAFLAFSHFINSSPPNKSLIAFRDFTKKNYFFCFDLSKKENKEYFKNTGIEIADFEDSQKLLNDFCKKVSNVNVVDDILRIPELGIKEQDEIIMKPYLKKYFNSPYIKNARELYTELPQFIINQKNINDVNTKKLIKSKLDDILFNATKNISTKPYKNIHDVYKDVDDQLKVDLLK